MTSFLKSALVLCLVTGLFSGCSSPTGKSSNGAGWISLFDGKNIEALRGYKQETFPEKAWTIDNGALKTVPGVGRVDLISREKFKDFELELEWKVSPAGNSGVFYGVQETDGPVWHTGPEMQVLDDARHRDGQTPNLRAGSLYAMIAPTGAKLKPVGEFNKARVVAKNGHVEHWLNGEKIVEYDWNSPQIQKLIAESKFKNMPRFMKSIEGHIALQHHGEEAWFRNVRIRRL